MLSIILPTQQWYIKLHLGGFCISICHGWVGRMIDSLYNSGRNISERCENSFVNYGLHYWKLCYSLRRTWTQPMYCNLLLLLTVNWSSGKQHRNLGSSVLTVVWLSTVVVGTCWAQTETTHTAVMVRQTKNFSMIQLDLVTGETRRTSNFWAVVALSAHWSCLA